MLTQQCQMLFAEIAVAERCGIFHKHPHMLHVGSQEGSSFANNHESQHPADFFHIELFKPSVQSVSLLPPVLSSPLILADNTQKSFRLQSWECSFLWSINLCIKFSLACFFKGSYFTLTNVRDTQKAASHFSAKQTWGERAVGGPSLMVSTSPRSPVLSCNGCTYRCLCLSAILASLFSETPKYLSDLGRVIFTLLNKWQIVDVDQVCEIRFGFGQ